MGCPYRGCRRRDGSGGLGKRWEHWPSTEEETTAAFPETYRSKGPKYIRKLHIMYIHWYITYTYLYICMYYRVYIEILH